jgi:hypothetical protein
MPNWFLQLCGNKPHASPNKPRAIGTVALTDHPTQQGQSVWEAINVRLDLPQNIGGVPFQNVLAIGLPNPVLTD